MILEIDWGNTRIKWRLRNESVTLAFGAKPGDQFHQLQEHISCIARPTAVWVASVRSTQEEQALASWVKEAWSCKALFVRTVAQAAGVTNGYQHPERLGVDRWLALLAAHGADPCPAIIVQLGTALTADMLGVGGRHLGGYIGPGWHLMRRALSVDTARVVSQSERPSTLSLMPGRNTEGAVEAALSAMVVGLVDNALEQVGQGARLILSGGDAPLLLERYPDAIHWPDIVLDGLYPAVHSCQLSGIGDLD